MQGECSFRGVGQGKKNFSTFTYFLRVTWRPLVLQHLKVQRRTMFKMTDLVLTIVYNAVLATSATEKSYNNLQGFWAIALTSLLKKARN